MRTKLKDSVGKGSHVIDMTDRKFERLLVVSRVDNKDKKGKKAKNGSARWECQCDCGKTIYVYSKDLTGGSTKSCGCLNNEQRLDNFIRVSGTCVTKIRSNSLYSNNKSGVRGVGWRESKGKWCARITFMKKTYELGCHEKLFDATAVRKQAEEKIFGEFLEWYDKEFPKKDKVSEQNCLSEIRRFNG